tara:strand:+ start:55 stop:453 length:399 start_codon:yes stop_codon:yes gene_type:complete
MKLKISKYNLYKDKTGGLAPFYENKNLEKFKIKRFFFLYGNTRYPRAKHAHKKCNQLLIPVSGSVLVTIINKKNKKYRFALTDKNKKILFVPKYHWIKINFKKKNSVILTLCDYKYDKKEYIQKLNELLKLK